MQWDFCVAAAAVVAVVETQMHVVISFGGLLFLPSQELYEQLERPGRWTRHCSASCSVDPARFHFFGCSFGMRSWSLLMRYVQWLCISSHSHAHPIAYTPASTHRATLIRCSLVLTVDVHCSFLVAIFSLSVSAVERRDMFTSIYIYRCSFCAWIYSLHRCRVVAVFFLLPLSLSVYLRLSLSSSFFTLFHRNHKIMGKNRSI